MSVETEFLQDKTNLCNVLDLGLAGHTLQSLISPLRNRKFPPMSHTPSFHVKIKKQNQLNDIYESNFIL